MPGESGLDMQQLAVHFKAFNSIMFQALLNWEHEVAGSAGYPRGRVMILGPKQIRNGTGEMIMGFDR